MEGENKLGQVAPVDPGVDQNEKKRSLAEEDEHDAKRVKTDAFEENGTDAESNGETKAEEAAFKPLPKGTAPVKAK